MPDRTALVRHRHTDDIGRFIRTNTYGHSVVDFGAGEETVPTSYLEPIEPIYLEPRPVDAASPRQVCGGGPVTRTCDRSENNRRQHGYARVRNYLRKPGSGSAPVSTGQHPLHDVKVTGDLAASGGAR